MQGINTRNISLPYADPGFCMCVGGWGWGGCLPENNHANCLSPQLYILHSTVIERRSKIRACPHSSERLIPGGGVLIHLTHMRRPRALLAKRVCRHTEELSLLQK